MVTPVGNKPIFPPLPAAAVSQLKGVSSIDSFTFGKQNLRPAISELFRRQGIEIKDIYLDNPARVRMMGMMPSFESLVAEGKTVEEIFSKLELSVLSTENENGINLYILVDKTNIAEATDPERNRTITAEMLWKAISEIDPSQLPPKTLSEAGGYQIVVDIKGSPIKLSFEIFNVIQVTDSGGRKYLRLEGEIQERGIFLPDLKQFKEIYLPHEKLSVSWSVTSGSDSLQYKIENLDLRIISQAILKFVESLPKKEVKPAQSPELRPKIEESDGSQRIFTSDGRSFPREVLFDPARFPYIAFPAKPNDKLFFLFSVLKDWRVDENNPSLSANHILVEIQNLFQSIVGLRQKDNLINTAILLSLQLLDGNRNQQWVGMSALARIPIPPGHPKLSEISQQLVRCFGKGKSDYFPVALVAARATLALKDSFTKSEKDSIRDAALDFINGYLLAGKGYIAAEMPREADTCQSIVDLLDQIIKYFVTRMEDVPDVNKSNLNEQFALTIFDNKMRIKELVFTTLSVLTNSAQFKVLLDRNPEYPLDIIAEALYHVIEVFGRELTQAEFGHIVFELDKLFRGPSKNSDNLTHGIDITLSYLGQEDSSHQRAGAVILGALPLSDSAPRIEELMESILLIVTRESDASLNSLLQALYQIKDGMRPGGRFRGLVEDSIKTIENKLEQNGNTRN